MAPRDLRPWARDTIVNGRLVGVEMGDTEGNVALIDETTTDGMTVDSATGIDFCRRQVLGCMLNKTQCQNKARLIISLSLDPYLVRTFKLSGSHVSHKRRSRAFG